MISKLLKVQLLIVLILAILVLALPARSASRGNNSAAATSIAADEPGVKKHPNHRTFRFLKGNAKIFLWHKMGWKVKPPARKSSAIKQRGENRFGCGGRS
jgi:hypothetical protein